MAVDEAEEGGRQQDEKDSATHQQEHGRDGETDRLSERQPQLIFGRRLTGGWFHRIASVGIPGSGVQPLNGPWGGPRSCTVQRSTVASAASS